MSDSTMQITKEEAKLIRFYGGLDECLWSINYDLGKKQRNLRRTYDIKTVKIIDKLKKENEIMKGVESKMNTLLFGDEEKSND